MSKALKWIPDKKDYIPYDLPDGAYLLTCIKDALGESEER